MQRRPVLSRRALIAGGAALGVGAGGIALGLGDRGGSDDPVSSPDLGAPGSEPAAAPTPTSAVPAGSPGGSAPRGLARLYAGNRFNFDTLDAVRTGEPSTVEVLGRTHSRLVSWATPGAVDLEGDLAESWELVDATTWFFHLRSDAHWQARPGLEGRPVHAEDLRLHLERVIELAGAGDLQQIQRPWDYEPFDQIEAPDDHTLRITTSRPFPRLLSVLAGQFAFIQRPEALSLLEADGHAIVADHVSGSGPFRFDGQGSDGVIRFGAAGQTHRRPTIAELVAVPAVDTPDTFLSRRADEYIAYDRRAASAIRVTANGEGAAELPLFDTSPVISSMFVGAPPWDDENLRLALSSALNRRELGERLFGGRAQPSGHIPPASLSFALPDVELAEIPGYRQSFETDAGEARARWEAAAASELGVLSIDFPNIFDPLYSASSVVPGMLREVLGVAVEPRVDSYVNIAAKAQSGHYGNGRLATWFGWGPATPSPDPAGALIQSFLSRGAAAGEAGFSDPLVDRLLDNLAESFDEVERVALAREVEAHLLSAASGGVVPWLLQQHEVFRWPYLSRAEPSPFGIQHLDHLTAVDTSHTRYPPERR